jgi:hypothetical protein
MQVYSYLMLLNILYKCFDVIQIFVCLYLSHFSQNKLEMMFNVVLCANGCKCLGWDFTIKYAIEFIRMVKPRNTLSAFTDNICGFYLSLFK